RILEGRPEFRTKRGFARPERTRTLDGPEVRLPRARRRHYVARDAPPSSATPLRTSMARTLFAKAFSRTPLPTVPTTKPIKRPLRFLPSRTTSTSMSVIPSGLRVKLYVWPELPPHALESVVLRTTWLGSDQS